ncbi:MAG: glycoside hydrolase family 3 protein [Thermoleophilia bacterium]
MEQSSGGKRADRHKRGRKGGKQNNETRRSRSRWYRRPAFIAALLVLVVAGAAGAAAVYKLRIEPSSDQATEVTTASGGDVTETTAVVPLASAAEQITASMSLEQKVGQMMMVGFAESGPGADITNAIQNQFVGGVVIYSRNIVSHDQVAGMNAELQKLAADAGAPAKLLIAVDQEGGKTRRFDDIGPYYSEPMIGEMHDTAPDAAQQQAVSTARDLKKLGFNTNLAPVADVSSGWGSYMDGRSFSTDSKFTAELTARAVKGYNNSTIISTTKHFPGLGSANADSEVTLPTLASDLETIQSTDLPPFTAAIAEGAPMIMVAHLAVPALDATNTPASLSKPIITDLLRGTMGFTGVVITDDLEMGAITESMEVGDAAVAAVAAGADIVMVAQTPKNQTAAFNALITAVKSGKLKEADIDKSVVRIINMKKKFRLEK